MRRRLRTAVLLCLAVLLVGTGCGGPARGDSATVAVERLLARRAEAVLERDEAAYEATAAPGGPAARATEFGHLAQVPLRSWEYRLTRLVLAESGATASVELRYRLDGYDRAPVTVERTVRLERRGERWSVADERSADKGVRQLWEQGEVTAVRGERSLVLGVGRSRDQLRGYAGLADRAVPAVRDAWGRAWAGRVVVLVPGSLDGMAGLLGAPAAGYQGIAAVTTGEVGGGGQAPADRIIVNPEAYDVLSDFGKQVVLTHEATHVATRAYTSAATPLWLSEGFADWVGYRGSGRTAAQTAPELHQAVRRGQVPGALPDDKAFGFGGDSGRLARAYEGSLLACRMIAERWGEPKLRAFYEAVGARERRAGAVDAALRDVLGTTPGEFTAQWRAYLRAELA
ncbi:hypothetical protein [Streptomyces sp. NPDC002851]